MKLNLSHSKLIEVIGGSSNQDSSQIVDVIYYDTRLINTSRNGVFFALSDRRNGHDFVETAYDKGIRTFVVSEAVQLPSDAIVITVENTLRALQQVAKYHRNQFSYPVLAITGSLGKTTIKEWLYFLLSEEFNIVRSPKSYNSQIGVAISLLEMTDEHDFAIIEVDISHPNEMEFIEDMVSPALGIYTGVGHYYADNFESQKMHAAEHLKLFKYTNITFTLTEHKSALRRNKINAELIDVNEWNAVDFTQLSYANNRIIAMHVAAFLGVQKEELKKKADQLPVLSNRMEVFEGQDNNLIINDSYNIDIDALEQALSYQFSSDERKDKIVVLDLSYVDENRRKAILEVVNSYQPTQLFIIEDNSIPKELLKVKDASILFKGSYRSNLKETVQLFKNRKHETWVEFDLKSIEHNVSTLQKKLPENTKTLVMVKASSYGTGDMNIPHFLQQLGIDYLGVAYTDEGTTLRENGIKLPILIMNTEMDAFEDVIRFNLEPSLFSIRQLEAFCKRLSEDNITDYPIHITVETGMNRLGFYPEDLQELIEKLKQSPEVKVKSVYSHLADADNTDPGYTLQQIERFKAMKNEFEQGLNDDSILFHILNSEGTSKFGNIAAFDMVRLGIGVFGYTSTSEDDGLLPSIQWKTTISQIKSLNAGETVGYGRTFKAEKAMEIATLRIGYADGFRRSLSNGVGAVFINGVSCPVVGNVCMDMTMVDVSNTNCQAGDEVEIIGENITIKTFSKRLNTIPYEVMTSINKRVARVYLK
ncbi:alanine racemase [Brumimicrobium aurantiacum]|uniref:Alanine racemase n=1 Tax=Brumimicrobium aurantiacum TaxID=1737063 RepID=A0A3E1EXD0_9FLAO|nr:alanine racemase [Brumimicrobium aurantiacum]RFC54197.1 alanine racemase [Brumimicrobium aurantiacum]